MHLVWTFQPSLDFSPEATATPHGRRVSSEVLLGADGLTGPHPAIRQEMQWRDGGAMPRDAGIATPPSKAAELRVFIFLAVILAPVLSVAIVGGYGFLVWMSQLILGPPTG
jgi:nitrate reductase NapE